MVRILWYLLFLVTYGVMGSLVYRVSVLKPGRVRASFWTSEAIYLLSAATLYCFVLVLTRFSVAPIAASFFISAQVPIILNVVLDAIAVGGDRNDRRMAEIRWATVCFNVRHKGLMAWQIVVSMVVGLGYPVVAGILYFSGGTSSAAKTLAITQVTLVMTFFSNFIIFWPTQVGLALSENLSAAGRWRLFGLSLASLVPTAMLLAAFLWTFDFAHPTVAQIRSAGSLRLTYSAAELTILLAYFVTTLLLPHVVGTMRGTRWLNQLTEQREATLTDVIRILRIPKPGFHTQAILTLVARLQQEWETLATAKDDVVLGLELDELRTQPGAGFTAPALTSVVGAGHGALIGTPEPGASDQSSAHGNLLASAILDESRENPDREHYYYLARDGDPRFAYLDWLGRMIDQLRMTASELIIRHDGLADLSFPAYWANSYEEQRRELRETARRGRANPLVPIIAGAFVTSVVTVLFTGFANWLWPHIAQTLPK